MMRPRKDALICEITQISPLPLPKRRENNRAIRRPAGAEEFIIDLERKLGKPIARRSPRRKSAPVMTQQQLNLLSAGALGVAKRSLLRLGDIL
jgi:hypothetical protein